jgi:thiamine-phosphate pyrophosphorylase
VRVHAIVADLATAQRAVAAGATVVQLRVKAGTDEVVQRGRGFGGLGVTFVVNDDVERARAEGLLLGRSAASLDQAVGVDADYLGVGPVWETPSKADADPAIGLEGLREIARAVSVPVIAIGGVDASNAGACIGAGAAGVAVIRAATDPALREAVDEALGAR